MSTTKKHVCPRCEQTVNNGWTHNCGWPSGDTPHSTTKKLSEKLGHWSLDHDDYSGDELAAEARALEERVAKAEASADREYNGRKLAIARAEAAEAEVARLHETYEASADEWEAAFTRQDTAFFDMRDERDALRAKLEDVRTYVEVYAVLGVHGDSILAIIDGEGDDE